MFKMNPLEYNNVPLTSRDVKFESNIVALSDRRNNDDDEEFEEDAESNEIIENESSDTENTQNNSKTTSNNGIQIMITSKMRKILVDKLGYLDAEVIYKATF
jgi:hypothetical protein